MAICAQRDAISIRRLPFRDAMSVLCLLCRCCFIHGDARARAPWRCRHATCHAPSLICCCFAARAARGAARYRRVMLLMPCCCCHSCFAMFTRYIARCWHARAACCRRRCRLPMPCLSPPPAAAARACRRHAAASPYATPRFHAAFCRRLPAALFATAASAAMLPDDFQILLRAARSACASGAMRRRAAAAIVAMLLPCPCLF